jgi:cell division protein FtsQ
MIKKILHIILIICLAVATFVLLGATSKNNRDLPCKAFIVTIDETHAHRFIHAETLKKQIYQKLEKIEGQPIEPGKMVFIKNLVEGNPFVNNSEVYRTLDGNLVINIQQRRPILRVINRQNQHFYLDENGQLMPFSDHYSARVMIANGYIQAGYSPATDLQMAIDETMIPVAEKRLRDLYKLSKYIDSDPFLKALIDQIYVTSDGQFELTPINGAHIIEFGHASELPVKFDKLRAFYHHGLSRAGWNYYKRINLKYQNQVVCSK